VASEIGQTWVKRKVERKKTLGKGFTRWNQGDKRGWEDPVPTERWSGARNEESRTVDKDQEKLRVNPYMKSGWKKVEPPTVEKRKFM